MKTTKEERDDVRGCIAVGTQEIFAREIHAKGPKWFLRLLADADRCEKLEAENERLRDGIVALAEVQGARAYMRLHHELLRTSAPEPCEATTAPESGTDET